MSLSPHMKIMPKETHQIDRKLHCTINMTYPQIQGKDLSGGAKEFNQRIEKLVN